MIISVWLNCLYIHSLYIKSWYLQLLGSIASSVNPLGHAPVFQCDAFQEVEIHIEANAEREEREIRTHDTLYVLLDGAEFDLSFNGVRQVESERRVKYKHLENDHWSL